jgi:hypothetical protein
MGDLLGFIVALVWIGGFFVFREAGAGFIDSAGWPYFVGKDLAAMSLHHIRPAP